MNPAITGKNYRDGFKNQIYTGPVMWYKAEVKNLGRVLQPEEKIDVLVIMAGLFAGNVHDEEEGCWKK